MPIRASIMNRRMKLPSITNEEVKINYLFEHKQSIFVFTYHIYLYN
jgi:hypothetical protein